VTRAWEVADGSGHGPFNARARRGTEGRRSLFDRHAKGLRLWIRLSKDSWVEGYGLDVRPQMPIRSRRAGVCTDAAILR
jgi:hypothetical protein